MRAFSFGFSPVLAVGFLVAGCATTVSSTEGSSSALTTSEVTVNGKLVKYGTGGQGLPGATVCVDGHDGSCVTTGSDGSFSVSVSLDASEDLLIRATFDGDTPLVFPRRYGPSTGTVELGSFQMISASLFRSYVGALTGAAYDPTKGAVLVNVADGSWPGPYLGGATLAYAQGYRVVYNDDSGLPSLSTTATSASGRALASIGNIPVGTVNGTVTAAGKTCTAVDGWSSTDGSMRFPVIADAMVSAVAVCR
jgi:hypothetical protein